MRRCKTPGHPRQLAHLYAREYCELGYLTPKTFARCHRFATVRDPYDRLVSEYRYRPEKRQIPFAEFVCSVVDSLDDRHLDLQSDFVLDANGKVLVDRIIRFESLESGFAEVSNAVFGRSLSLPHVNRSQVRTPVELDENVRGMIYRRYERDFDLFRYPSGRALFNIPLPAAEVPLSA